MPTLFEISEDILALDMLLEETGGDISDPKVAAAVDAWFAELNENLCDKVDNYCAYIAELNARAAARREAMERLAKRVKTDENAAKSLKARLQMVFEQRNLAPKGKPFETGRFRISLAGNGGPAPMTVDSGQLPKEFWMQPPPVVDYDKVRKALEAGQKVPGAALMPRGQHLNIR